jgi:hypothetical protein
MSASAVSPPGTPRLPGDAASRPSIDTLYLADAMMEAAGQKPHLRLYPYLLGVNRIGTTAVAANATVSEPVPVGGDANFMAMGLLGQGANDFLVNLKWSHLSGTAIGQIALHSKALFGTQWKPFRFPRPQLVPHDATLTIELTNLSAAVNAISLYAFGYKVLR